MVPGLIKCFSALHANVKNQDRAARFPRQHYRPRLCHVSRPSRPIDRELYDYSTPLGAREIDNQAGRSGKEAALQGLLDNEVLPEVRAPLPAFLNDAQEQGLADMRALTPLRAG